jgi:hypothetical protein
MSAADADLVTDPTLQNLLAAYAACPAEQLTEAMRLVIGDRLEDLGDARAAEFRKPPLPSDILRAMRAIILVDGELVVSPDGLAGFTNTNRHLVERIVRARLLALVPILITKAALLGDTVGLPFFVSDRPL